MKLQSLDRMATKREIAAKHALETAMQSEPADEDLRALYFRQLGRLSRTHVGLCEAWLPELPHPLTLRCGSSDFANLEQIFLRREYDFPLDRPAPERILDLGAYAGYAAIHLANRFPGAQILCVEPVPATFRLLLLNTLRYRNITHLNAAAWSQGGRLRIAAIHGGHWGYQLSDAAESDQGAYRCFSIPEILRMRGWDRAEFVKCDIEGAEAALFADTADWIGGVDVLAIETHDHMAPNSAARVAACFGSALYTHSRHYDLDVYERRNDRTLPVRPPIVSLINPGPGLSRAELRHVLAEQWGFFLFDERGCQLHPNQPGEPAAQMIFTLDCDGHNRFTTGVLHAGETGDDVIFRVTIRRLSDQAVLMDSARRVLAGAGAEWSERTPLMVGTHEIVLQTEMAEGATSNARAWARWIDPRLG